jgi:hypothetical protein
MPAKIEKKFLFLFISIFLLSALVFCIVKNSIDYIKDVLDTRKRDEKQYFKRI